MFLGFVGGCSLGALGSILFVVWLIKIFRPQESLTLLAIFGTLLLVQFLFFVYLMMKLL